MGLYILATEIGGREVTLTGEVRFKRDPQKNEHEMASNNVATLYVAMLALQRLTKSCDHLEIYTDSEWLGYRMEEIDEMSRKDWKDSRGREAAGVSYWKKIQAILEKYNLRPIIHVKEHHSFKKWFEEQEKLNG